MTAAQAVPVAMAAGAGLALGWRLGRWSARRQVEAMGDLLDRALAALVRTTPANTQTAGGFGGVGGQPEQPSYLPLPHAKETPQTPFAGVLEGDRKMPPGAGSEPVCSPPAPAAHWHDDAAEASTCEAPSRYDPAVTGYSA